jgi:hypothetical protein
VGAAHQLVGRVGILVGRLDLDHRWSAVWKKITECGRRLAREALAQQRAARQGGRSRVDQCGDGGRCGCRPATGPPVRRLLAEQARDVAEQRSSPPSVRRKANR